MTMQITRENINPTTVKLTAIADPKLLGSAKQQAVSRLGANLRIQGFRPGKAPLHIIEKQLDQQLLQSEVLESAVNQLYIEIVQQEKLRPVAQPKVSIQKFVPFETLEVSYEAEVIGEIVLPDLSKLKLAKKSVSVTENDVDEVVSSLRSRAAEKQDVKRAAKSGDQATIDFTGVDAKTKESIQGAAGNEYPLVLGSNSFIPGFEDELIGLKAGDTKDFTITFPEDYGATELQKRKVIFTVTVKSIQKLTQPKLDDTFAGSVGPFKTMAELRAGIKEQLKTEREQQAEREYENQLLELIANKTDVAIPEALVEEEIDRIEAEDKRNIVYRGQTWQEHLADEGVSEDEHRNKQRPAAELRVKAGLVLSEIADQQKITVEQAELDQQIQMLKARYNDASMQAELDKPENRRDILSRILSQKALEKAKELVSHK